MGVLLFILVPLLVVAVAATISWARNRQPTSLQAGVDSFRREMDALSPEGTPIHRRRADSPGPGQDGPSGPRRPPAQDRPA
ncbi:MAG: hypothetical protein JWM47_2455 [Acidimicrobiales bacterium]|nr:hypothetical protein [Acidimicrobiales bacterium]